MRVFKILVVYSDVSRPPTRREENCSNVGPTFVFDSVGANEVHKKIASEGFDMVALAGEWTGEQQMQLLRTISTYAFPGTKVLT